MRAQDKAKEAAQLYCNTDCIETLIRHFKDKSYSQRKIANDIIGCSYQKVNDWSSEFGIEFSSTKGKDAAIAKMTSLGFNSPAQYFGNRPGYTYDELGKELGVSEATARRMYKKAVQALEKKN